MDKLKFLKVLTVCSALGLLLFPFSGKARASEQNIVATTFPIYQILKNITQGRNKVVLDLMIPSQQGCPHDYTLTPQDMQKIANADILVANGLGMEEFLGAPVEKANSQIHIIDSSIGIGETLHYSDDHDDEHDDEHETHEHSGVNPHLFVSPSMNGKLAMNIAAELSKVDPNGAAVYFKNAQTYNQSMGMLTKDMADLGKRLKNNRIVQPHGVFDYLARDMGIEIIAVLQEHGQKPSASEMMHLVRTIKKKDVGGIFTEPQYPKEIGKTLGRETNIPVAVLDPVATGPENAPLNYFEMSMRNNMNILESVLGLK